MPSVFVREAGCIAATRGAVLRSEHVTRVCPPGPDPGPDLRAKQDIPHTGTAKECEAKREVDSQGSTPHPKTELSPNPKIDV